MMKKAIAGAVLSVLSLSLPAVAAVTEKYQFKGENASASFSRFDECNSTSFYISAYTIITKDGPGAPTSQMGAYLNYFNYNSCTGTESSGYGSSPNANFTIDNKLNSATLNGTFIVSDYSAGNTTTKTVDVALNWTGTDDYSANSKSNYTYQTPTSIIRYSSKGESRVAQVTGTIILDGTNLIANTSSYGELNSSKSGSLLRTRK